MCGSCGTRSPSRRCQRASGNAITTGPSRCDLGRGILLRIPARTPNDLLHAVPAGCSLCQSLKAVDRHADLLRMSHRLRRAMTTLAVGANEAAPPPFGLPSSLGNQLEDVRGADREDPGTGCGLAHSRGAASSYYRRFGRVARPQQWMPRGPQPYLAVSPAHQATRCSNSAWIGSFRLHRHGEPLCLNTIWRRALLQAADESW